MGDGLVETKDCEMGRNLVLKMADLTEAKKAEPMGDGLVETKDCEMGRNLVPQMDCWRAPN